MTADRRSSYTRLDEWRDVLSVPGVTWVNLQYDQCDAELDAAEQEFGVRLHRWEWLDLMNDLDEVAALTAALDLVVSPRSAVSMLVRIARSRDHRVRKPPFLGRPRLRSAALAPCRPHDLPRARRHLGARALSRRRVDRGARGSAHSVMSAIHMLTPSTKTAPVMVIEKLD